MARHNISKALFIYSVWMRGERKYLPAQNSARAQKSLKIYSFRKQTAGRAYWCNRTMYVGDVKTDEISILHAGFYLTKRLRKLKWSFFFVSTHAQLRPHTERPAWQNSFWCISKISDPNRSMTKVNLVFVTWIQIFFSIQ